MIPVDVEQMSAAVAEFSRRSDKRCLLCGTSKVHAVSTFVPNEPWQFGGPPPTDGKVRAIIFALCWKCAMRDALSGGELAERALRNRKGKAS
jgi:hypothetical protein